MRALLPPTAASSAAALVASALVAASSNSASARTLSPMPESLVIDTGRIPWLPPPDEGLLFQWRGEYQLRPIGFTNTPLQPFGAVPNSSQLGQEFRLTNWLRNTFRLQIGKTFEVVAQIDFPALEMIAGKPTQFVSAALYPFDKRQAFRVDPRWLYVQWDSPVGRFRVGQQPLHWGMGLVWNDGNRPVLFGDYLDGSIVERILYAVKPGGKDSDVTLAAAGDLVFEDQFATLTDGAHAFQGMITAAYSDHDENYYNQTRANRFGIAGVFRHQDQNDTDASIDLNTKFHTYTIDVAGQFATDIPGSDAYVFGAAEFAYALGTTQVYRPVSGGSADAAIANISSYGGAAHFGLARMTKHEHNPWAWMVSNFEWGYASGDSNPFDESFSQFNLNPNHQVGLVLFGSLMNWKSARAATILRDPALTPKPPAGTVWVPTNGGVSNAVYVYSETIVRPVRELDLKLGIIFAEATASIVDPALSTADSLVNYEGGDPEALGYGVEVDIGVQYRLAIEPWLTVSFGAEGGMLFPGHGFNDIHENGLANQFLGMGRLGVYYGVDEP
jgi:hypothetical protein